jgi:uncharacterized protein YeaO (DUF488 family)
MMQRQHVQVRRIYDSPTSNDGTRVLVDRIWPRGVSKDKARLDQWCKDIAPSTELRKWYHHDPTLFDEFVRRYHQELTEPGRAAAIAHLHQLAKKQMLTLLTATKDVDISEAAVLADLITTKRSRDSLPTSTEDVRHALRDKIRDITTCKKTEHDSAPARSSLLSRNEITRPTSAEMH